MNETPKVCPKCGKLPLPVNSEGLNWPTDIKYYSCDADCMPVEEFYTLTAWNNMAEREDALRAEIARLNEENERIAKEYADFKKDVNLHARWK